MAKVEDMLEAYLDERTAEIMRAILSEDIPEVDMVVSVRSFHAGLPSQLLLSTWSLLSSRERSSWKKFLDYENWLIEEKRRAYH